MPLTRSTLCFMLVFGLYCLAGVGADKDKPDNAAKTRKAATPKVEPKVEVGAKSDKDSESSILQIIQSAERFVAAYNQHDAKAIAEGFTATAEFVTEAGVAIRGRKAIEGHFAAVFARLPKTRLELHIESTKLINSNVAIEEGRVELVSSPGAAAEASRYVAVHVLHEGEWLLARTRDFSSETEPRANHERLKDLEWLIGEWMQEGEELFIATSCHWGDHKNYLMQEFTIRLGGQPPVTGSTRIGWDPLTQQIKSWTFDSDGGYSESLWTRSGDKWILKSQGVTHLGRSYSGTAFLQNVDGGTMSWESRDRVEGGVVVPDRPPILVKRLPPAAEE